MRETVQKKKQQQHKKRNQQPDRPTADSMIVASTCTSSSMSELAPHMSGLASMGPAGVLGGMMAASMVTSTSLSLSDLSNRRVSERDASVMVATSLLIGRCKSMSVFFFKSHSAYPLPAITRVSYPSIFFSLYLYDSYIF